MSRVRRPKIIGNFKVKRPPKIKKGKRPAHKAFIASLPCVICGHEPVEVAHLRFADAEAGKATGMGQKPDDMWVNPLCAEHHRLGPDAQHGANEREWWASKGIDPIKLSGDLWAVSGDFDSAVRIIRKARS